MLRNQKKSIFNSNNNWIFIAPATARFMPFIIANKQDFAHCLGSLFITPFNIPVEIRLLQMKFFLLWSALVKKFNDFWTFYCFFFSLRQWNRSSTECGKNLNYSGNEKELTMNCKKCVNYLFIYHPFFPFFFCLSPTIYLNWYFHFDSSNHITMVRTEIRRQIISFIGLIHFHPGRPNCFHQSEIRNSVSYNERKFIVSDGINQ